MNKEYHKEYYQRNKEKMKADAKANYHANRDRELVRRREYYDKNKEKLNSYSKEYQEINKDRISTQRKLYTATHRRELKHIRLIRSYGISIEEYDRMFQRQKGKCAICKAEQGNKILCIDHDHSTGKVRQLLCSECNLVLGKVKDSIPTLKQMITYIRKHNK